MIAFSCSHCGMKLKVKPEFAGRSSRCPTCKQPLVVPIADQTQAFVPDGPIDGSPSSLAQAKVEGGVTLEPANARPGQKSVRELLGRRAPNGGRYIVEAEIARGGMGAILRAVDCDIRREVAVKYMLDQADPKKKLRFIEEAQITGQLEHPNIVPIHEIGMDAQQRPFFAMKMVQGRSLKDILDDLRGERGVSTPRSEKDYSLGRLLNIFVNVCNALAYANSRGVVHRDLKPANIMTGDFGEVYVMDWGLAKVVRRDEPVPRVASIVAAPVAGAPMALPLSGSDRRSKVDTSREPDADLTQEGTIMGTPVYMPPEQATGQVQAIDQRSDVYSLGAILYELLTLQPPIDKEGGYLSILMRVAEGRIVPPEQREPKRAMAGKVPRELAAIAMKALAKKPEDRYPNAEALRRDIERFLEGRSVSAKSDTVRELLWKLVKRNKGASAASVVGMVLLLIGAVVSFVFINNGRLHAEAQKDRAEKAYADYQQAQGDKEKVIGQSLPAMVRAGRQLANEGHIAPARAQVELALTYDPNDADARLLKAQILISQKDWQASRNELTALLQKRPDSAPARSLLERIAADGKMDSVTLFALAELLRGQQVTGLAIPLLNEVQKDAATRLPLVRLYQQQIEAQWPGLGKQLSLLPNGQISLSLGGAKQVTDLTPLQGMQVNVLSLQGIYQIRGLGPLKGMPLTSLDIQACEQIQDLGPLQGMPLTYLNLVGCKKIRDFSALGGMKLTELDLRECGIADLTPLQGMPLTKLTFGYGRFSDLKPLEGMPLKYLDLYGCSTVHDLAPLTNMPLKFLNLYTCNVKNLTPLKGMPLEDLNLHGTQVADLTPLKGMPLARIRLVSLPHLKDLGPLQGMPLRRLEMYTCAKLHDLTPLRGMELTAIGLEARFITRGMDVLREMKSLTSIRNGISGVPLSPKEFWRRYDAGEFKK